MDEGKVREEDEGERDEIGKEERSKKPECRGIQVVSGGTPEARALNRVTMV